MNGFGGSEPLVLGEVYGMRTWTCSTGGDDVDYSGKLYPRSNNEVWTTGENVAHCRTLTGHQALNLSALARYHALSRFRPDEEHRVPPDCGCGFWAYHDVPDAAHGRGVLGVIRAYGMITTGTKGFRAEKAVIEALYLPALHRSRWRRAAGSPVTRWALIVLLAMSAARSVETIGSWLGWTWWAIALAAVWFVVVTIGNCIGVAMFQAVVVFGNVRWIHREWHKYSPELQQRIADHYPDARVFTSIRAMRRAYPFEHQITTSGEGPDVGRQA